MCVTEISHFHFRNTKFWMIGITYGVSLGVYGCWQSVLDVILKPHGISEVRNYRLNVILKPHGISEVRNYRLNVILKLHGISEV